MSLRPLRHHVLAREVRRTISTIIEVAPSPAFQRSLWKVTASAIPGIDPGDTILTKPYTGYDHREEGEHLIPERDIVCALEGETPETVEVRCLQDDPLPEDYFGA